MSLVTRPRRRPPAARRGRSALVSAVLAVLLVGAAGCDSGDDIDGDDEKESPDSGEATDAPAVETMTTLQNVGRTLDATHRERLKETLTAVLDPYLDGAFLGSFPRDDYTAAFASFTPGAAEDAQGDLDLLTSAGIADQIDEATATKRRVRVDVFAVDGHPRGVTAHFVLELDTTGTLEESVRVRGDLFLAKEQGEWQVFGYDVEQAEQL
jgi:hypothetical protein